MLIQSTVEKQAKRTPDTKVETTQNVMPRNKSGPGQSSFFENVVPGNFRIFPVKQELGEDQLAEGV